MVPTKMNVLLSVGVIFVLFPTVSSQSINCFVCNSVEHKGCAELTTADTNSRYFKSCEDTFRTTGKTPFCRKTIYMILDEKKSVRISRSCGWEAYKNGNETHCYDVDTDFKYEVSCQCFTDGCNTAVSVIFSRSTLLLALLMLVIKTAVFN